MQTLAARAVLAVLEGNNAECALARVGAQTLSGAARSALTDLTLGTLRFLGECRALLRHFARARPQPLVEAILWVAFYQLRHCRTAVHVVVSQAVAACGTIDAAARGFANAVLRNYLRDPDAHWAAVRARSREAEWNHPEWWIAQLEQDYPEAWQAILRGGNMQGPLTLRVNARRATVAQVLERFAARRITARALFGQAIMLNRARAVERLPGFRDGWFSVQDAGAQLAAPLLDARDGMRVLDACAAPGGKTAHLAEHAKLGYLLALDIDPERCERIHENLARLGLTAEVRVADARDTKSWWDGAPFDRILLDAPCTGSGVVRRHPDAKWLKRPTDIAQLARLQAELIDRLWPTLAVGGRMLYVTCSVFRAENSAQIEAALARHPDMRRLRIHLPGSPASSAGQLFPGGNRKTHNHDGYFYALLEKQAP
ncbi:MAG: 16S rRNA (cytosine(967)-C(5))-methyltransferase RsmB [Casimicrobiaceae bacterium]|nr:16S rRNA (cytosine(967)-C(5))-methyltransferase RsmB [Casimicrobiaceae bacterium]MDW8311458.1 16S rRNA (cytosine(967)-C(5))-methyltransferase RsmB [Burkholderiales bacterium]